MNIGDGVIDLETGRFGIIEGCSKVGQAAEIAVYSLRDKANQRWAAKAENCIQNSTDRLVSAARAGRALAVEVLEAVECYCADNVAAPAPCAHCIARGISAGDY